MIRQISDNVHGAIVIEDKIIDQLISTREFRRLQNIEQLGLTHLTYPSSTHSRYSHSLGVYELARRFMDRLGIKDETKRLSVLVAALLHDVGHGPLSHLFEGISAVNHEKYTVMLMEDKESQINKVLAKYPKILNNSVKILEKKHSVKWMNTILSSQIDVDRLDYLKRDSLGTGSNYGVINDNWLFRTAKIVKGELVYEPKAIAVLEQFIVGRYHMYTTVYHHPKNIMWQEMYTFFFRRLFILINNGEFKTNNKALINLAKGKKLSVEEFVSIDDHVFMNLIKEAISSKDKLLKKISTSFYEGKEAGYEILKNKKEELSFLKNVKEEEKGITWNVVTISSDINRYGSHQSEEAVILDGAKKFRISKYSRLIERALSETEEYSSKKIGVKI